MSLLMDALKRAETSQQEAARSKNAQRAESPATLSLEPLPSASPRSQAKPLPELAAYHDAVDAELANSLAAPTQPSARKSSLETRQQAERDAVRNAFTTKQSVAPPSRPPFWPAIGLLVLAGLGIAGYVAYRVMNLGSNAPQPTPLPTPAPAANIPRDAAQTPPPVPAIPVILPPAGELTAGRFSERRPPLPSLLPGSRPAPLSEASLLSSDKIRLTRSHVEVDANQARGYANLQRNELELARRDYEQALQRDPNNTDTLLALAAIAQRQGRPGDAERLHQRALIANPSDPAVQGAALNGATAAIDPQQTESRLKSLLATEPESASLNFALGNLYARQNRWTEAQQVYFNAVAADSDNPDYLFNLAVSLDHIRQAKFATQHYRLALEAADKRPAAFEREQITRRLGELLP